MGVKSRRSKVSESHRGTLVVECTAEFQTALSCLKHVAGGVYYDYTLLVEYTMTTFSVAARPPPPPTSFPLAPHLPIYVIFNHSYYLPYRCWELSRTLLLSSFQCCCLFLVLLLLLFFCCFFFFFCLLLLLLLMVVVVVGIALI